MKDLRTVKMRFENCSTAIKNGRVHRRSNLFFEIFVRLLFRRVDFDGASMATLRDLQEKGHIVYASFQGSATSLLILTSLLRRHGFRVPMLALGITPYLYQEVSNAVRLIFRSLRRLFLGGRFRPMADRDCIKGIVKDREGVVVSLLSRRLFLMRYLEKRADPFQDIIEIQKEMEDPIFLAPQLIFWNMNPERTRSFLTSQATGDRGLISGLFTTMKSATPPSMRIAPPIDLKEFIASRPQDSPRLLAQRLRRRLFEIYNLEKRGALGPVIKTGQEMMESVLYHSNIIEMVKRQAEEQGRSERRLRKKAYRYYRGIAADFSIVVVKYFQKFMMWVFRRVFDGIDYSKEDFRMIREAARKGPLIILPCHRSHMDYLIISSLFYENRIMPPHILAGDNLSFFPLGLLFRKSGAFFMKRSTRGLDLYVAVLRQYIKTLVQEGYSIEFFIEGGRTRTGKTMHPKFGMLKYLIEALKEGYSEDMMLVPVGITYDRVLEEKSFQRELRGRKKEGESNKDLVKSGKYLRGGYGGVYLTFGEPMSFRALEKEMGDAGDLMSSVADRIVRKISDAVVVTPYSLVSAAMLVSSARGFDLSSLRARAGLMLEYLTRSGARIAGELKGGTPLNDIIDRVLDAFEHDGIISRIQMDGKRKSGDGVLGGFYSLHDEQRARINFYKNNIVHYFLPVSFYSAALLGAAAGGTTAKGNDAERIFGRLKELFAREYVYPVTMDDTAAACAAAGDFLSGVSALERDNGTIFITDGGTEVVLGFTQMVRDVMESFHVVFGALAGLGEGRMQKKGFLDEVRKSGMKRFHLGDVTLFESLSLPGYQSALAAALDQKALRERKDGDGPAELVVDDRSRAEALEAEMRNLLSSIEEAARTRRRMTISGEGAFAEAGDAADQVH